MSQIFGTCKAGVSILAGEHEQAYYIDVCILHTAYSS